MSDRTSEALVLAVQQLTARLDRLETMIRIRPEVDPNPMDAYRYALSQQALAARMAGIAHGVGPIADPSPLGPYTDPAPWPPYADPNWWRRPPWQGWRWPFPQPGDPAPIDLSRSRDLVDLDLVDAVARMNSVDAKKLTVESFRTVRLSDLLEKLRHRTDPPPDDWYRGSRLAAMTAGQIERMTKEDLNALAQDIKAERSRLDSLHSLVQERSKSHA
jgi:hypothetical protein